MISVTVKVKKHLWIYERNYTRIEQQDLLERGRIHGIRLRSEAPKTLVSHVKVPEFGLVEVVVVQDLGKAQDLRCEEGDEREEAE